MKCHYEVLNVPRDADDGEIKTAYRKLALKWHPDKNLNSAEEAKEQFQLVQQAYEILSDKQDRAWYDNHREQILKGSNPDYEDSSLNVFQYFTTTCFKGYSDDEKGFYTVYRNVFDQIIKEDIEHMDDREELDEYPTFGNSNSDYDGVVGPFYAFWLSYSTKKSYVWLDPYDIKETRDRRVVKLIEKENKKVRLKAKKERNEEVRNLVIFVRKRDKRVQANSKRLEVQIAKNRKKQEEISKQKRLQRVKELNTSGSQAEWTKFDNVKSELEQIERSLAQEFGEILDSADDAEENHGEDFYCVVCNKVFKTQKALENHESSKKHKDNAEFLKQTMLEEEEATAFDIMDKSVEDFDEEDFVNGVSNDDEIKVESSNALSDSDCDIRKAKKQKKKNKKSKNVLGVKRSSETDHGSESESSNALTKLIQNNKDSDGDFILGSSKKQKKNKKGGGKVKQVENDPTMVYKIKQGENSGTQIEESKKSETLVEKSETPAAETEQLPESTDILIEPSEILLNNSEVVENHKKTLQNGGNGIRKTNSKTSQENGKGKSKKGKKQNDDDIEELDKNHCCASCRAVFSSKNKLFDHLKSTAHSVYLPSTEKPGKNKKKLREK